MSLEYLSTEAGHGRRRSWIVGAAVAVALIVGLGVAWTTERVRQAANDQLSAAVQDAQDRSAAGEARVLSTLTYASPMIWSTSVPDDVRADLRVLVQQSAADVSATLAELADGVRNTAVLPWQGAQLDARDRVLALIVADQRRFDRIALDAREIGTVLAEPAPDAADALAALGASGAEPGAQR